MIPIDTSKIKEHILATYDQISIFSAYLSIPESDINFCLENKSNKISNPLRIDLNPSLGFMIVMDKQTSAFKLKMYDFADPYYRGDCFDLVGIVRSLHPNKGVEFVAICNDIILTMKSKTLENNIKGITKQVTKTPFLSIMIEPRLWNQDDITRWNNFGHPFAEIKHLIFPIKRVYISNYCDYKYQEDDPAYAWITGYYDNKVLYKIYYPLRSGKEPNRPRFKTNNKYYPLECIHDLKPADILVITKAYKEKLLIKKYLPRIVKSHTIEVTNFTSESIVLKDDFVSKLYDIYTNVVTNTDFDYTGLHTSGEHKRRYGMIRFIPTNGAYGTYDFGGKDLCDIFNVHGEQYVIDLLQESYNYLKHTIDTNYEKSISLYSEY